jgi:ubiquinone/menaquinone biosynthesis C-methylase UbiE
METTEMEPNLMRRVQRYGWDKAAPVYEEFWAAQLVPAQERLLERAHLKPGERVLDVACGTGLASFPAAELVGSDGFVLGTDISAAMISDATAIAAERGVANAIFVRTDAEELKLADDEAPFDVALCALGLMYVPDPIEAIRKMAERVRPDGRVVAAVWGHRRNCGWAEIFPIVDARVESDVCPMFFGLGTGDALALGFSQAGLRQITEDRITVTLDYPDDASALGAAFAGGPVALAYARFDDTTKAEAHAEYLASIAPFRAGTGYSIPGEFVVVSGKVPA